VVIECPRCLTRFRLDEARLAGAKSLLKCSRCQHVFSAPGAPPVPKAAPPRPQPEQESLSFTFDDDDDDWQPGTALTQSTAEEPFSLDVEMAPPEPAPLPRADKPERPRTPALDEDLAEEDFGEEEDEVAAESGGSISIRPVLIFLLLVVGAYAVLARALYADPDWAQQITSRIPLLGGSAQNRSLSQSVVLMGVDSRYEVSKEGKPVLLVRGDAQNQSPVALQNVQVVTRLFDADDRPIGEQVAFCGNSVRPELVRDLNVRQISILKGLKPPQRFAVQPGEKCPFVAIFTELPAAVSSFSAEVASAQGHA